MRKSAWIALCLLTIAATYHSCEVSQSVSGRNISHVYAPQDESEIGLQYKVLNKGNGQINLIWKLDPNTVGISKTDQGKDYIGFSFRYKIYPSYSEPTPLDSGVLVVKEQIIRDREPIVDQLELKLPVKRNMVVDITFRDLNSLKADKQYVDVFGASAFTSQSFALSTTDGQLLFDPYVVAADSYVVRTAQPHDRLYVKFYERDFPIAAAPFAIVNPRPFDFTPDHLKEMRKIDDTHFMLYVAPKGFYQIVTDSESRKGGCVYYFGQHYPNAKTVNDLVMPLRYITSNDEFSGLAQGDNLKRNVDAYWLNIGGNPDRARQLIGAYYSRVEHANRFFTSYLEGWKSDRGMCYIVFGPPAVVYRSTSSETWVYGEDGRYSALSLTFTKVVNPFTGNDFRLNRGGTLKTPWYRAVEFWRQGRVLSYQ